MMWSEYVTSSASTRMGPGATRLIPRTNSSSPTVASGGKRRWSSGRKRIQKARERPTRFSQVRLWDSPRPSDGLPASGVRSSSGAAPW